MEYIKKYFQDYYQINMIFIDRKKNNFKIVIFEILWKCEFFLQFI